ncbi:MAG: MauE/DoxX family redox-associated membrane protein [Mucilaginibacter sp.]
MVKHRYHSNAELVLRLLFIFLFVYTDYAKLTDHERFLSGLRNVRLIGGGAGFISWLVPLSEIAVAVLLILPITARWGLYAFTALMVVFTVYISDVLIGEKTLPCHCGGVIESLSWKQHLVFNLVFTGLGIYALRLNHSINFKLKT